MEDRSYNLGEKTCGGCTRSVKDYKAVAVQTREAVNRWISTQISSRIYNIYCLYLQRHLAVSIISISRVLVEEAVELAGQNYWLAPTDKTGEAAYLTIDLGCVKVRTLYNDDGDATM